MLLSLENTHTHTHTNTHTKGLNFVPIYNNIDKAKLKIELEAFGRMLRLKWHFHNENKDIHCDMFKPKSKFNPHDKDAALELY